MTRTMGNLGDPYKPTHPGEVLKEELEYRGISQKRFSKAFGISYPMLNEILNAKRAVTETLALIFEAALGIEAEMLVDMQSRYNLQTIRKDKKLNERLHQIRQIAAMRSSSSLTILHAE